MLRRPRWVQFYPPPLNPVHYVRSWAIQFPIILRWSRCWSYSFWVSSVGYLDYKSCVIIFFTIIWTLHLRHFVTWGRKGLELAEHFRLDSWYKNQASPIQKQFLNWEALGHVRKSACSFLTSGWLINPPWRPWKLLIRFTSDLSLSSALLFLDNQFLTRLQNGHPVLPCFTSVRFRDKPFSRKRCAIL